MGSRPLTERDVRELVRGLIAGGSRPQAEQVQRLWDELQGYRDREATTRMLMNMEGEI